MRRRHNPLEFYETPPGFTRFLDKNVMIRGHVYCPTVGEGAIVRALRERDRQAQPRWRRTFVTNDVDPNRDADFHLDAQLPDAWWFVGSKLKQTSVDMGTQPDWVVENPPFSIALPILQHALQTVKVGVALHVRISFLEPTQERVGFLTHYPPDAMIYLPRYSFAVSPTTGRRSTDSTCTAWCIWVTEEYRRKNLGDLDFVFYNRYRILVAPRSVADEGWLDDGRTESQGPGVPADADRHSRAATEPG